jgi:polyhydroxybutyrate depolymerase
MVMLLQNHRPIVIVLLLFVVQLLVSGIYAATLVEKSILVPTTSPFPSNNNVTTRWFLEYRPDNVVKESNKIPLVLLLHGGTQSMRKLFNRRNKGTRCWLDLSDTHDFLLLAPNGVNLKTGDTYGDNQNWSDLRTMLNNDNATSTGPKYDDVGFLSQLVQYAITEQNVDPHKVYVTGGSNGGIMTYTLLVMVPELFAAGVAFIANLPNFTVPIPNHTTPIMIMNGNKDRLMKWDGGTISPQSEIDVAVRSALATRDFWIQTNQASVLNVVRTTLPNLNWFDRCRIRSEFYPTTTNNNNISTATTTAPVQFYIMDGGGHSMPSRRGFFNVITNIYDVLIGGPSCHDVNGADLAWTFMSSFVK